MHSDEPQLKMLEYTDLQQVGAAELQAPLPVQGLQEAYFGAVARVPHRRPHRVSASQQPLHDSRGYIACTRRTSVIVCVELRPHV